MKRKTKISLPGPKGPPRLRDLQRLRDQPHEFLRELVADYGPVVTYGRGPFRFVLLTDPDDVRRVLVDRSSAFDKATFQYRLLRSITGDGLLTLDGPEWLERRRLELIQSPEVDVRVNDHGGDDSTAGSTVRFTCSTTSVMCRIAALTSAIVGTHSRPMYPSYPTRRAAVSRFR